VAAVSVAPPGTAPAAADAPVTVAEADEVRSTRLQPPSAAERDDLSGSAPSEVRRDEHAEGAAETAEDAAPAPTGLRIPALEIEAPLLGLGLQEDRSLEVPEDADVTGWWSGGSSPGERGPAVIVGHVDSYEGPGVFFRLAELEPGDHVTVDREDGTSVTYAVQHADWHRKDAFPTQEVYGATDDPTLRLVTCGGEFDPAGRSYEENLVVFLELVGWS
jgi:sortase (surface protein transpeptidase)